jgi:hypothetical protein
VQIQAPERVRPVAATATTQVVVASSTPYSIWFALSGMIDPYPSLKAASLINPAGYVVRPGPDTILSLINDFANSTDFVFNMGTSLRMSR